MKRRADLAVTPSGDMSTNSTLTSHWGAHTGVGQSCVDPSAATEHLPFGSFRLAEIRISCTRMLSWPSNGLKQSFGGHLKVGVCTVDPHTHVLLCPPGDMEAFRRTGPMALSVCHNAEYL